MYLKQWRKLPIQKTTETELQLEVSAEGKEIFMLFTTERCYQCQWSFLVWSIISLISHGMEILAPQNTSFCSHQTGSDPKKNSDFWPWGARPPQPDWQKVVGGSGSFLSTLAWLWNKFWVWGGLVCPPPPLRQICDEFYLPIYTKSLGQHSPVVASSIWRV